MLNDIDCGSRERVNTIRSWLARFNIPEQDEFFLLWSKLTAKLVAAIRGMEEQQVSSTVLEMAWNRIFRTLYLDYDTTKDFMPQFEQKAENLFSLCHELEDVTKYLQSGESK